MSYTMLAKVNDSQRAVQSANRELTQTKREYEDYKKRAAGILQVSSLPLEVRGDEGLICL